MVKLKKKCDKTQMVKKKSDTQIVTNLKNSNYE